MEKIELIRIPFYKWELDRSLVQDTLNHVKSLEYKLNTTNAISITDVNYTPLYDYINSCLEELKNELYPPNDKFKLVLTECWANKNLFSTNHHRHHHPNSICSGIIYLNEETNIGNTKFHFPNPFHNHRFEISHKKNLDLFNEFIPKTGTMIIFPSDIDHEVSVNKTRTTRYTISFNSFFKGELGVPTTKLVL